jgi:hypothetical protein
MASSWSETLNMATAMLETVVGVVPDAVVESVMPRWTTRPARTHRSQRGELDEPDVTSPGE